MIDNIGPVLCHRCLRERARQMRKIGPNEGINIDRLCRRCREKITKRLEALYGRRFS